MTWWCCNYSWKFWESSTIRPSRHKQLQHHHVIYSNQLSIDFSINFRRLSLSSILFWFYFSKLQFSNMIYWKLDLGCTEFVFVLMFTYSTTYCVWIYSIVTESTHYIRFVWMIDCNFTQSSTQYPRLCKRTL